MPNHEKNRRTFHSIVSALEGVARQERPSDIEKTMLDAHLLFLGGYHPRDEDRPVEDFPSSTLNNLLRYYELRRKRTKKIIAGGEREITSEDEALESLALAGFIARDLIVPNFTTANPFSNSIFKDIHNLGLSYAHAITGAVADEYIPSDEATEAKLTSIDIAKGALRFSDAYLSGSDLNVNRELQRYNSIFNRLLQRSQPKHLRSFEMAPTTQKHIYHGSQLMKKLCEEIAQKEEGKLEFSPLVVFPIAQGGNEFGIRISMAYEDRGHFPITYPLLYSIKTRRHRRPWIDNDYAFLGKNLENSDFLVAEDWVTTGNTLRGILTHLELLFPRDIRVATLKRDPEKSRVPLLDKYHFYVGTHALYLGGKTDALSDIDS